MTMKYVELTINGNGDYDATCTYFDAEGNCLSSQQYDTQSPDIDLARIAAGRAFDVSLDEIEVSYD